MVTTNKSLFSGINNEQTQAIYKCFKPVVKTYETGDKICTFNDAFDYVGIVKSGAVSISRIDINGTRVVLENVYENEIFGKIFYSSTLFNDEIYVDCLKSCTIMYIDYYHITRRCENACLHHSILVQNMLEIISHKASVLSQRVEVLSRRTIKDKVITYFKLCSSRCANSCDCKSKDGCATKEFELPFSYSNLADYLCIDRSAMMREIKNLRDEGVIKTDKRKVELIGE